MLWLLEAWKIYIIVPSLEKSRAFFGDHQCLIIPFSPCPEANEGVNLISAYYGRSQPASQPLLKAGSPLEAFGHPVCFTLFLFSPDLVWKNIELKVEVESLKRELQEREQLLIKAS